METRVSRLQVPIHLQCELVDQLIVPILLYVSEVWGFHKLDQIEMLHKMFLKHLLNVNKHIANCIIYGEFGQRRLDLKINMRIFTFLGGFNKW